MSHLLVRSGIGALSTALATAVLLPAPATADAAAAQGAVAPNGRLVVTGANYVVSMLPDGTDRQHIVKYPKVAYVGNLDVTADGAKVAMTFGPGRRSHIYTVDADGQNFMRLTSGAVDSDPSFSPNGSRIVFSRYDDGYAPTRMRSDGTDLTVLTTGAEPSGSLPSWSPDGKYIAFVTYARHSQSLVVTDPSGTWFRFVRTFGPHGALGNLDWSPDSSGLVFTRWTNHYANADLWTIDADGDNLTQITDTPKLIEDDPAYSPNGVAIACSLSTYRLTWADVVVMNPDGTGRNRIETPKADEFYLAWGG